MQEGKALVEGVETTRLPGLEQAIEAEAGAAAARWVEPTVAATNVTESLPRSDGADHARP